MMLGLIGLLLLIGVSNGLVIYSNGLLSSEFSNWSWGTYNFTNTDPSNNGRKSIAQAVKGWDGLQFSHLGALQLSDYYALEFYVNGGVTGGQKLFVGFLLDTQQLAKNPMEIYTLSRTIPANAWEKVTIPLTMLRSRFSIIMFQSAGNDDQGTVYYDHIELIERKVCSSRCSASNFVDTWGTTFSLNRNTFYPVGGSVASFPTVDSATVDAHLLTAVNSFGFNTIRTFGNLDIGTTDGTTVKTIGKDIPPSTYFQYWDGGVKYNTGANGIQLLDYIIFKAKQMNLKVIIVLTNNNLRYGGIDQYLTWYNLPYHDNFFTDTRTRASFKAWISFLLNRVNPLTSVAYKDEPTIMSFELSNAVSCTGELLPTSGNCNVGMLYNWISEMSSYIKQIDPNHLVAVGDEGFFNWGQTDIEYNSNNGVDNELFLRIPTIDYGTAACWALDKWDKYIQWGEMWIDDHVNAASSYCKPFVLNAYGVGDQDAAQRTAAFKAWYGEMKVGSGDGDMIWSISAPNFAADKYSIFPTDPATPTILQHATEAKATAIDCYDPSITTGYIPMPTPMPTPEPTPEPTPPTPQPTPSQEQQESKEDEDLTIVIAGLGAGLALAVIAACGVGCFLVIKRRNRNNNDTKPLLKERLSKGGVILDTQ